MKLEFPRQIFAKFSNIKYHEIRPVGAELFHVDPQTDIWTDRRNGANSRFSQFCERDKSKNFVACRV